MSIWSDELRKFTEPFVHSMNKDNLNYSIVSALAPMIINYIWIRVNLIEKTNITFKEQSDNIQFCLFDYAGCTSQIVELVLYTDNKKDCRQSIEFLFTMCVCLSLSLSVSLFVDLGLCVFSLFFITLSI